MVAFDLAPRQQSRHLSHQVSVFLEVWVQFGLLRMMRVLRIVRVVKIIRATQQEELHIGELHRLTIF